METVIFIPWYTYPDSKVHGAYMGPIWGRQDPCGPHMGHVNLDIWVLLWIRRRLCITVAKPLPIFLRKLHWRFFTISTPSRKLSKCSETSFSLQDARSLESVSPETDSGYFWQQWFRIPITPSNWIMSPVRWWWLAISSLSIIQIDICKICAIARWRWCYTVRGIIHWISRLNFCKNHFALM